MSSAAGFQVETDDVGPDQFVVALTGEVDLYTAPDLRAELARVIDLGATRVVIDLSATTFIDSTTLGVLLGALKRLRPEGGEIALACPNRNIRKIFEITLLDRVFAIFNTRAEALAA